MVDKDELEVKRDTAFNNLMRNKWGFFYDTWPEFKPTKYHRKEIEDIKDIEHVKKVVLDGLGYTPVFFFLTVLFPFKHHPGPRRNVEKGLLLIYQLITGDSFETMERFIPQSSMHAIHRSFYGKEGCLNTELDKDVNERLLTMFSNIRIRILSAILDNPKGFKHVTLLLDGHDTRGKEFGEPSAKYFSQKHKKAGFRTQVITDINGMVIGTSESRPCKDHPDGVMFTRMNLDSIEKEDCVGLDGGYTLFIKQVVQKNRNLHDLNFYHPVRKPKGDELLQVETKFNKELGSLRSSIEAKFGELKNVFEKFHQKPIRTSCAKIFNLQFKVACLLLNIKKFVALGKLKVEEPHLLWYHTAGFDYPSGNTELDSFRSLTLREKIEQSITLSKHQAAVLANPDKNRSDIDISDIDMSNEEDIFEIEKIEGDRWKGNSREYLVKWKGSKETTWLKAKDFITKECIIEYLTKTGEY